MCVIFDPLDGGVMRSTVIDSRSAVCVCQLQGLAGMDHPQVESVAIDLSLNG
jgi:hypothetical protein